MSRRNTRVLLKNFKYCQNLEADKTEVCSAGFTDAIFGKTLPIKDDTGRKLGVYFMYRQNLEPDKPEVGSTRFEEAIFGKTLTIKVNKKPLTNKDKKTNKKPLTIKDKKPLQLRIAQVGNLGFLINLQVLGTMNLSSRNGIFSKPKNTSMKSIIFKYPPTPPPFNFKV
jgi:hypothetical protein